MYGNRCLEAVAEVTIKQGLAQHALRRLRLQHTDNCSFDLANMVSTKAVLFLLLGLSNAALLSFVSCALDTCISQVIPKLGGYALAQASADCVSYLRKELSPGPTVTYTPSAV
jgi:hypothetical protein